MKKILIIFIIIAVNGVCISAFLANEPIQMIKTYPAENNINSNELYNKQSQNTQGILIKEDAESTAKKYLENFFEDDLSEYKCTSTYNRDEYGIVMEMWSVMFEKDEKVYFADIVP